MVAYGKVQTAYFFANLTVIVEGTVVLTKVCLGGVVLVTPLAIGVARALHIVLLQAQGCHEHL